MVEAGRRWVAIDVGLLWSREVDGCCVGVVEGETVVVVVMADGDGLR